MRKDGKEQGFSVGYSDEPFIETGKETCDYPDCKNKPVYEVFFIIKITKRDLKNAKSFDEIKKEIEND